MLSNSIEMRVGCKFKLNHIMTRRLPFEVLFGSLRRFHQANKLLARIHSFMMESVHLIRLLNIYVDNDDFGREIGGSKSLIINMFSTISLCNNDDDVDNNRRRRRRREIIYMCQLRATLHTTTLLSSDFCSISPS